MFKNLFYLIRANKALAEMGLDPSTMDPHVRRAVINFGKRDERNPQEAALILIYMLPAAMQPMRLEELIADWSRDKVVDREYCRRMGHILANKIAETGF